MKRIVCMLCLMAMVLSIVGCKGKESEPQSTSDSAITTEETVADISEDEEMENLPFAEKEGLEFITETDIEIPARTFFVDEDGNEIELDGGVPIDHPRSLSIVSVEKADAGDGNVTYTIDFQIRDTLEFKLEKDFEFDGKPITVNAVCFDILDYYTGMGCGEHDDGVFDTVISWKGKDYNISYQREGEQVGASEWETIDEDDKYITRSMYGYSREVITITAPEDYDGLLLYTLKAPYVEDSDDEGDDSEEAWSQIDFDQYSANDYYFLKVSDLLQMF